MPHGPLSRPPRVAIVGAGLGGLFAAVALARAGCAVTVLERAAAPAEVGAGVQISPNAARLLERIGALEPALARGFEPRRALMRDGRTGATLLDLPLGAAARKRWGAPYLQIHRADLLQTLLDAAQAAGAEFRFDAEVAGLDDEGPRLRDGGAVGADVTLGADGVRSAMRATLFGPAPERYLGQTAWRATIPAEAAPAAFRASAATVWVGPGRHLVVYPLRGGALINVVAVVERADWAAEDWSTPGDPDALRAAFAGWAAAPLLAEITDCLLWGLHDRPAPPAWSKGRVALMGDACHPMLPFMAQGASQAFEDGAALARLLPGAADIPAALAAYEAARRPRATRVQGVARANARLFHAAGPARLLRQGVVAVGGRLAPGIAAGRLDWLYGHVEPA
jgi:salicylate hydroxylase